MKYKIAFLALAACLAGGMQEGQALAAEKAPEPAYAKELVETMEKLEEMGFSGEEVISKAKELYAEYGEGLLEHVSEAASGTAEEISSAAAESLSGSFWASLWEDIKNFFQNLFSGF